jgi:hypothetical protein
MAKSAISRPPNGTTDIMRAAPQTPIIVRNVKVVTGPNLAQENDARPLTKS